MDSDIPVWKLVEALHFQVPIEKKGCHSWARKNTRTCFHIFFSWIHLSLAPMLGQWWSILTRALWVKDGESIAKLCKSMTNRRILGVFSWLVGVFSKRQPFPKAKKAQWRWMNINPLYSIVKFKKVKSNDLMMNVFIWVETVNKGWRAKFGTTSWNLLTRCRKSWGIDLCKYT